MRSPPHAHRIWRRVLVVVGAVIVLVLVADTALWWVAGRKIEAALQAWVQQRRADGLKITMGAERLSGWPTAAIVEVADFSVSGGEGLLPRDFAWRVPQLRLIVRLRAPWWLEIAPVGVAHARIARGPELSLAAAELHVALSLRRTERLRIVGRKLHLGAVDLAPELVTIGALSVVAAPSKGGVGEDSANNHEVVQIEASGVGFGEGVLKGARPHVAVISANIAVTGPTPRGPDWQASLRAWRDANGMIAVRSFSIVSGPLAIGGSARFELDQALQPAGQGRARIVGFVAALDALAKAHVISDGEATAAKAIMMLLARPSHQGGPPEVDVPIRLDNGVLSVGRIPLLRVPKVRWPTHVQQTASPL